MSSTPPHIIEPMMHKKHELLARTEPISRDSIARLGLDPDSTTVAELSPGNELYKLVCQHIVKAHKPRSLTLDIGAGARAHCCDSDDEGEGGESDEVMGRVACSGLGLGSFTFVHEGKTIHALHQTLGEVVGTNCGPAMYRVLILATADGVEAITHFCDQLIAAADKTSDKTFNIFRWHVQYSYWQKAETATARPIESVVLPKSIKAKLVDDLEEFVSCTTKAWYQQHGVPYKRSYLLHGTPGAGKTSLIQALAGRFKRNVCYLSSLSHPEMTDDGLKAAIQRVPAKSLVVLEDVDALFSDGRSKRNGDKSALTFSGVLNALDGVGASTGQVFILTTNHRDRLDAALIRNGRVDVHVEFTDATSEQMVMLFRQFYPTASDALSVQFAEQLGELLGERSVSMAALQHFFIMMRKRSAEEAAASTQLVIDEMMAHGLAKEEAKGKEADKEADKGDEEQVQEVAKEAVPPKGKRSKGASATDATSGSKDVHVHLHVS